MLKAGVFVATECEFTEEHQKSGLFSHEKVIAEDGVRVKRVLFQSTYLKTLVWIHLLVQMSSGVFTLRLVYELTFVVNGVELELVRRPITIDGLFYF